MKDPENQEIIKNQEKSRKIKRNQEKLRKIKKASGRVRSKFDFGKFGKFAFSFFLI